MASIDVENEKPNLRPSKHTSASGRSIFLHYNPYQPLNKSYIQATRTSTDQDDLFGLEQANVEYSLNKQNRWKVLANLQGEQTRSLSDDELRAIRDSEPFQQRKYRLHQRHGPKRAVNCITITNRKEEPTSNDSSDEDESITYLAVVPTSREKQLSNIRSYGGKNRKRTVNTQHFKANKFEEDSDLSDDSFEDEDEWTASTDVSSKPNSIQLNDFLTVKPANSKEKRSSRSAKKATTNTEDVSERKLHYYKQRSKDQLDHTDGSISPKNPFVLPPKPVQRFLPLTYQTVLLHQLDFTRENLLKEFGRNFLQARCSPTTYLLYLKDRLEYLQKVKRSQCFTVHSIPDCYLIIVLNDPSSAPTKPCQAQIALNVDLSTDSFRLENPSQRAKPIFKLNRLMESVFDFLTNLSPSVYEASAAGPSPMKFSQTIKDMNLNENEFINRQIDEIHSYEQNEPSTKLIHEENTSSLSRSNLCTSCYADIGETTPITALTTCQHWFCNTCWRDYLENSVKTVKIILCPEWNCRSIVDIGTMFSLVNIRCINIYKRNLDRCLVNVSRSYIKCPAHSCLNIVQVVGTAVDSVRCRCGHQFCIICKEEPHFPATCAAYRAYVDLARRNGDFISPNNWQWKTEGRNCISCNEFIEKNGGCNHMRCRCGAEFCWACTAYWKGHTTCAVNPVQLQKRVIKKEQYNHLQYYSSAIAHRLKRTFENQTKQNEKVRRLIGTIPLDKESQLDVSAIQSQIAKREELLRHAYEIVKYIASLHRTCEFIAVAADGHGNTLPEFASYFSPFDSTILLFNRILETGKGYPAIEELHQLHRSSEKLLERLRQAVLRRQTNATGYATS